jgi:DNA-binding IclR family transcriptional regulator
LNIARPTISRDLAKLQEAGIVETMPSDATRYRLGPKMIQIARAHAEGIALMQQQIDQVTQRYSRQPS